MEGAGSRHGRATSRYVPSPPPPPTTATKVFNGPVRKWKKKWVHVSSPNVTYQNSRSRSSGHGKPSRLLLCRWTPISPRTAAAAAAAGDVESFTEEQQPRRKFRYTPIVVLDTLQKKEVDEKVKEEVKTIETYQSAALPTSRRDGIYEKPSIAEVSMRDTQASNQGLVATQNVHRSQFDLDLFFTANSDDHNSLGQNEETQFGRGSSGGFWAMG